MLNNREQLILSPWAWYFGGRVEVVEDAHRDAQTEWHSARLLDVLSTVNQRVKQSEVKTSTLRQQFLWESTAFPSTLI